MNILDNIERTLLKAKSDPIDLLREVFTKQGTLREGYNFVYDSIEISIESDDDFVIKMKFKGCFCCYYSLGQEEYLDNLSIKIKNEELIVCWE